MQSLLPQENYKEISLSVYGYQEEKLREIAIKEGVEFPVLIRTIIERSLGEYLINHLEIKERCFCNKCGRDYPKRKMHLVVIGYTAMVFCDYCFFSGKYKDFIFQLI